MNSVISLVLSCLLNASSPAGLPQEAARGECSGSYIDSASGHVVGAWTMQVAFEPNANVSHGVRVVKHGGNNVIAQSHRRPMDELSAKSLRALAAGFHKGEYELVFQDKKLTGDKAVVLASVLH